MSTRRLILTALACGMAILVAGGVFLVRVAGSRDDRTVTIHRLGEAVRVGDLSVTIVRVDARTDAVQVGIVVDAMAEPAVTSPTDAAAPWTLLVRTLRPAVAPTGAGTPCRGQQIEPGRRLVCELAFAPGEGAAFLAFDWRGDTVRWRLDPATGP